MVFSEAYLEHLKLGPFPGRVDPWAEDAHYFQQIHSGMIEDIINQVRPRIIPMGYRIAKEVSLQIAEGREPDISIQRVMNAPPPRVHWDYELVAAELLADAGVAIESDYDLQAIHIKEIETGKLVTVIEIISPGNKIKPNLVQDYRMRRERLVLDQGVNVVEVDLIRSLKRLFNQPTVHPYHVIIFLPGQSPRHIEMEFEKPLSRIALPLRETAILVDLQQAYTNAYQHVLIAQQMEDDQFYTADHLPFPSLLTEAQQASISKIVAHWQSELQRLRG